MDGRTCPLIAYFLTPNERITLAQCCSSFLVSLKPTLSPQFDSLLQYQRWRRRLTPSDTSLSHNTIITEDKSWFPSVVFTLEYDLLETTEAGKCLLRNKCGDVLVLPSNLVNDEEDSEEIGSGFSYIAEGPFTPIDFGNASDMLKRQKAMLNRVNEKKEEERMRRKEKVLSCYRGTGLWGVILCHGGYFSLGIFDHSNKCLLHQSDHRYVTRKKQGSRQLAKDKHSGSNIHSAGSSVRRAMEQKHQEAITSILTTHKAELRRCEVIFLHAPGVNRGFFVTEGAPLSEMKGKVRSVGVTPGRANYTEVQRIQQELSTVELRLA